MIWRGIRKVRVKMIKKNWLFISSLLFSVLAYALHLIGADCPTYSLQL